MSVITRKMLESATSPSTKKTRFASLAGFELKTSTANWAQVAGARVQNYAIPNEGGADSPLFSPRAGMALTTTNTTTVHSALCCPFATSFSEGRVYVEHHEDTCCPSMFCLAFHPFNQPTPNGCVYYHPAVENNW